MRKEFKRGMSMLLALCMLVGLMPVWQTEARAVDVSETEPDVAVVYNGHYYGLYDTGTYWRDAKTNCEQMGGHLVTITSAEEQNAVTGLLGNTTRAVFWIGAEKQGKVWTWVTGETWKYTNWNVSEPSGDGNYAQMLAKENGIHNITVGAWNDKYDIKYDGDFWGDVGYICEWEHLSDVPFDVKYDYSSYMETYYHEHLDYYQSLYSQDIVSMAFTNGLGYILDDLKDDFDVAIYKAISFGVADASMIASFISPTSYFDIDWGNGKKLSFQIPEMTVQDLGSSEYSVVLYQLLASDDVYSEIVDIFSTEYEKNIQSFANKISENIINIAKDDITEGELENVKAQMKNASEVIRTAEANSAEFSEAYQEFEVLGTKYLDLNKTKNYLTELSTVASDSFSFLGAITDQVEAFVQAYQYACWAESYAVTDEAFKSVLKEVSVEAQKHVKELNAGNPAVPEREYSEVAMYRGLANAIDSFIETMEKNAENTQQQFVQQVKDATGDTCVELVSSFLGDKAEEKLLGGSICPELAAINAALSSGKLLIDLFTDADDIYKIALTVESLDKISEMLIRVSKKYGELLLEEEIIGSDQSSLQAVVRPVTTEEHFQWARLFDESIKIYKNAVSLACEYGIEYENDKLDFYVEKANCAPDWWYDAGATTYWQKAASKASSAITFLTTQEIDTNAIKCHSVREWRDTSETYVKYTGEVKVIDVACPVDVSVCLPDGTEIARLGNDGINVLSGYEPYFYTERLDNNDVLKVAVIPCEWNCSATVEGTDSGKMTVIVGLYDGTEISSVKTYANYQVTEETRGTLENESDSNPLGDLVLNTPVEVNTDGSFKHVYDEGRIVQEPTCSATGERVYTCTGCKDTYTEILEKTEHSLEIQNAQLPTCTEEGYTGDEVCTTCDETVKAGEVIPAKGHKTETTGYVAPTCTKSGWTGTGTCTECGETVSESKEIPATGHTKVEIPAVEATCTTNGITAGIKCSVCGEVLLASETVPAKGHTWDDGKVTKEPTITAEGVKTYTCTVCGATKDEAIEKLKACDGGKSCPAYGYHDVDTQQWYHLQVDYVIDSKLMVGDGGGIFRPNEKLTRAEMAQIMYSAAGRPEVTGKSEFTDVKDTDWFANAVIWATQNGVVYGVGDGKFAPNDLVTREQLVAMIYRYAEKPATAGTLDEFADASKVSSYAVDAMRWAVEEEIVHGDGTPRKLRPSDNASRAEVATILYQYFG